MNIFEDKQVFGKKLRKAMAANKVNAKYVSDRTGLSQSSISRYLSYEIIPRIEACVKIAEVLHIDPMWLFGFDDSDLKKPSEYRFCPWCGERLER